MHHFYLLPALLLLLGCGGNKPTGGEPEDVIGIERDDGRKVVKSTEETLWINSSRVDCREPHHGVLLSCYEVNRTDRPERGPWTPLDHFVLGFDYEPGNLYRVRLRRDSLSIPEFLMDARSIEYTVTDVLETRPTSPDRLHDIWALQHLGDDRPLDFSNLKSRPTLEIFVAEKRLGGTDGCNRLMGALKTVDQTQLEFGPLAGTKMMCPDMDLPERLRNALTATRRYELRGLQLLLLDADNRELARFQKVD